MKGDLTCNETGGAQRIICIQLATSLCKKIENWGIDWILITNAALVRQHMDSMALDQSRDPNFYYYNVLKQP